MVNQYLDKKLLIIGHPRSGTGYMSRLMSSFGLNVGHEKLKKNGISSWMLAVDEVPPYGDGTKFSDVAFDKIIRVVRHPILVISSSIETETKESFDFRSACTKPKDGLNQFESAIHILLEWDNFIKSRRPDITIHAECAVVELSEFLGYLPNNKLPPKDINKRDHGVFDWKEIKKSISSDFVDRIEMYANEYGYDLSNTKLRPIPFGESKLSTYYNSKPRYYSTSDRTHEILKITNVNLDGKRILDLGCGSGQTCKTLEATGASEIVGVDYSSERTLLAKKVCNRSKIYTSSIQNFVETYDGERFDVILALEVIEHLKFPSSVIYKARKLLKPDGVMVGTVPINKPDIAHLHTFKTSQNVAFETGAELIGDIKSKTHHLVVLWKNNNIYGVTVSVNYADMLSVTLPYFMNVCDTAIVVTEIGDSSIDISNNFYADVVLSNNKQKNGLKFNKGAMINDAFGSIPDNSWVVLSDADTIVSPRYKLPNTSILDKECVYGANFLISNNEDWTPENVHTWQNGSIPKKWKFRRHRLFPGGSFQMFYKTQGLIYPDGHGLQDYQFVKLFKRYAYFLPSELCCVHLGPTGRNHSRGVFVDPNKRKSKIWTA